MQKQKQQPPNCLPHIIMINIFIEVKCIHLVHLESKLLQVLGKYETFLYSFGTVKAIQDIGHYFMDIF